MNRIADIVRDCSWGANRYSEYAEVSGILNLLAYICKKEKEMNYDKVEEVHELFSSVNLTIGSMRSALKVVSRLFSIMCLQPNLDEEEKEFNKLTVLEVDDLLRLLPLTVVDRMALKSYFMQMKWMEVGKIADWNPSEVTNTNME